MRKPGNGPIGSATNSDESLGSICEGVHRIPPRATDPTADNGGALGFPKMRMLAFSVFCLSMYRSSSGRRLLTGWEVFPRANGIFTCEGWEARHRTYPYSVGELLLRTV